MKSFLIKLLIFTIPFIIIGGVNYHIDNAYIFTGNKEYSKLGKLIAKGNHVTNLYNFREFMLLDHVVRNMDSSPQVIILGSSRSMQINSSLFNDQSIYNASVSNVTIMELIACYALFFKNNHTPKTVILGLEPWIFTRDRIRPDFVAPYEYMSNSIENLYIPNHIPGEKRVVQLFNPVYFIENIKNGRKTYKVTKEINSEMVVRCSDGSLMYGKRTQEMNEAQILKKAIKYTETFDKLYLNRNMDNMLIKTFTSFVKHLQQHHTVVFFLPPYHPYISAFFDLNKYRAVKQTEAFLKDFAQSNHINIIGSFDPKLCSPQITSTDFYDGSHPKREAVELLFRQLFNKQFSDMQ